MNVGDKVVRYIGDNLLAGYRPQIWEIESIEYWSKLTGEGGYQMYKLIRQRDGEVDEAWVNKVTPLSKYMINFL